MAPLPEMSHEQRMELAARGEAMPDGSYPTPDCAHVKHAVQAYGREVPAKQEALRKYLVRRAVKLGCTEHIPDDWHVKAAR